MKISEEKLKNLSKAIYDIGKLSFGALVLGNFIAGEAFVHMRFITGLIFTTICFLGAFLLDR